MPSSTASRASRHEPSLRHRGAARRSIGPIKWEDNPILVRQKSRDFYWYSPVLKRELEAVTADVVVSPTSEAEVRAVLAAAYRLEIPVTPRGAGTGNYGQAMPLTGGVLLNLAEMNKVKSIRAGPRRLRARRAAHRRRQGGGGVGAGTAHVSLDPRHRFGRRLRRRRVRRRRLDQHGEACAISAMSCACAS